MSYQNDERRRLSVYAAERWGIAGHVVPYEMAHEMLFSGYRTGVLDYFERHRIAWWRGPRDKRTQGMAARPTGYLTSSQVACVNHLEPARVDHAVAERLLSNIHPGLTPAPLDDGYVEYEGIGRDNYLGESGSRTRGANVTSLDALMLGVAGRRRVLVAIEWKYLERYGVQPTARSSRGTDRVAIYQPLLKHRDCPIATADIEDLFFEPYDQLMRQALLVWQMVEHREFEAIDWVHVHVIPSENRALRGGSSVGPGPAGGSLEQKWKSVLKDPNRYYLVTPSMVVDGLERDGTWADWENLAAGPLPHLTVSGSCAPNRSGTYSAP